MATYGEGDPTDNAKDFMKDINDRENEKFKGLRYTVFGLGNT